MSNRASAMPNPNKSNVVLEKNPRQSIHGGKETEDDEGPPSHSLWIGNLSNDTTDSDLMDLFAKYGALDSVTTYSSRNFAFIYFKRLEDARAAKDALQGIVIRGNQIKIEFARPAKPGKHLWVGGISSSVTKEQVEDEFLKFGRIEDFKFLRDRNSALIDYYRLEDAAAALKNMNGKRLGGEQIRVDYLRSQPSRRENWTDFGDSRDVHFNNRRSMGPPEPFWMPPDAMRNFPESSHFGHKRQLPPQHSGGRRGDGQPSNVLWIGYPPSVQMEEQMLHNAMILFGEIERIKSFPSRHYSFVEFRSVDEARRAKEGLQGRLFNDPRIQILFSSSELAPPKDSPGFFQGIKGPRPDMFFNEPPFGPGPMDFFGHNRPMAPNNFPGPLAPKGMPGPNMQMGPLGPQGGFNPLLSGPEIFNDLAGLLHNFSDGNPNSPMGPNWRRLSPAPGMGMRPPFGSIPGTWDGSDAYPFQRESKRSRLDGPLPIDNASFNVRKMDGNGDGEGDQSFVFGQQHDRGAPDPLSNALVQSHRSPLGVRTPSGGPPGQGLPDSDHCWRGIIAKGGTPVCHARCVPIGKGMDSQLPETVNCSARTGLDMLTKHYAEANGFDIVFFLPDSEDDFASYTEFLRYLGAKNRAGVAKLDDGTTLFLVPPSDFLTKVLNVSGPERLYGVVLKLPQQIPNGGSIQPQQPISTSQYIDRQLLPSSQTDYSLLPHKEDQVLQMDYNRILHEDANPHPPRSLLPPTEEPSSTQSVPLDFASNPASMPQTGVSLTPELIATLAALLPANMQSSSSTNSQLPFGSSAVQPTSFPASVTPDQAISSQGWRQDHQANATGNLHHSREEQTVHPSQQFGHQFNTQAHHLPQFPAYTNVTNMADHSAQAIIGSSQIQEPAQNAPQQSAISSRPNNFLLPSQGGQFTVRQQANQQFQLDASQNPQTSYGTVQATDANGLFSSPVFQQPRPPVTPSTQIQGTSLPQQQLSMTSVNDKVNMVIPNQVQQLQSALSGVAQGTADGEADKNQRYQSTLQFAANLLLQIQQQQQQGNAQGSGNI